MNLYEARRVVHGGTFNGFPFGMAAVKATLEILAEEGGCCYELMAAQMREVHSSFLAAAARHGLEFEMKGVDAAGVYHAASEGEDATKPRAIAQYLVKLTSKAMVENGVLVSNLNRFYGSVAVSAADVMLFKDRIERVFEVVGDVSRRTRC